MGKLVPFQKSARSVRARPLSGKGEVVIFTGVRYEREIIAPGKPPASARPKRKRG